MALDAALAGTAQQQNAAPVADGSGVLLRTSRAGQLCVADWKTELVLGGFVYNVTVGGISAGADVSLITGGGAGTTVDTDQPEMAIGTPEGYFHIPLRFTAAVQPDMDADPEEINILLFADLEKIIPLPIAASSTVETPQNLLDGGPTSVSYAQSAVTTDITDPVMTVLLDYSTAQAAQVDTTGTVVLELNCDYNPTFPMFFKGPCSIVAAWGGTEALTGACSYTWAEVPVGRIA